LVLWDYGLAVDFPAGSTILLPSSVVIHSNTSIKEEEERFSIVQYAASGLFRWAENHCSNHEPNEQGGNGQWAASIHRFTNIMELVGD
jgi:hypothetical protein